jgi:membrane-associated protein
MLYPHAAHLVAALNPLSSTSLLTSLGALGVFLVLFAETGLLVGFFLPGDSLLFTAGLLCTSAPGHPARLSLPLVILAAVAGAILGAQTGFYIGRTGGRRLVERSRSRRLRQGAERAGELLARYGHGKAIVLARFIPIVRTVVNPVAGALGVPARTFTTWQVVGGALWSAGLTLAGYALGSVIPGIDAYLLPVIAVVVIVSFIPVGIELLRSRAASRSQPDGDHHGGAEPTDVSDSAQDRGPDRADDRADAQQEAEQHRHAEPGDRAGPRR